jgi:photosystem II stability/assembly factor-like uncharacterized protein
VSTDAGATFSPAPITVGGEVLDIALDAGEPDRVAAGVGSTGLGNYDTGGVLLSDDGGATWANISIGLARGALVRDLAFDAQGRLYAATGGAGVYRLRDRRP